MSRPEKVLFPGDGITKGDLMAYYQAMAGVMLPHVAGRPLVMQRFPDGIDADGFYEKRIPGSFPGWVGRAELPTRAGGPITYVAPRDEATLAYLGAQACITPHAWLSTTSAPERPDRMIFDLDPPGDDPVGTYPLVRWTARELRGLLSECGLPAFVMSSGSRGLHVTVPIVPDRDFDAVREIARGIADALVDRHPGRLTTAQRKADRGDALFIDVLRNGYGQTAVAPYAVRARRGAPVAAPLDWNELGRTGMQPQRYTLHNVVRRLAQRPDPWAGIADEAVSLDNAAATLSVR